MHPSSYRAARLKVVQCTTTGMEEFLRTVQRITKQGYKGRSGSKEYSKDGFRTTNKYTDNDTGEDESIFVDGKDVPDKLQTFEDMFHQYKICRTYLNTLCKPIEEDGFGFTNPTPIQKQVIPALCSLRDVLAFSATGSGKTLAYALPMLHLLRSTHTDHPASGISDGADSEDETSTDSSGRSVNADGNVAGSTDADGDEDEEYGNTDTEEDEDDSDSNRNSTTWNRTDAAA
uniref:ATP-dependent RNA helicase n=2 Tax=Lygus hesperus TaxID=30085 RepID=A0A0A9WQE1_LYGHE